MPQISSQWTRIKGRLQAEVGDVEYRTWLRQMTLVGLDGDEITVNLPTRFLRDWVSTRYGDRLRAMWQSENPAVRRVDIRVGGATPSRPPWRQTGTGAAREAAPAAGRTARVNVAVAATPGWQDERAEPRSDLAAPLDPRFTFEGFVVGKPNEFAYACARRVAEHRPAQDSIRCSCTAVSAWARRI